MAYLVVTSSIYALLLLFILIAVFHLFVLFKIIHFRHVWGGRLKTDKEMYRFEAVSLILNSLFIYLIASLLNFVPSMFNETGDLIVMWVMVVLFAFNTIGNMRSSSKLERIIFTPLTIIITTLLLVILLSV